METTTSDGYIEETPRVYWPENNNGYEIITSQHRETSASQLEVKAKEAEKAS